ncbi:glycerophosphodiester phosphodiesterase family protein [Microtetraspora malaysiensis]|uniref:glycerophosphodiester phosphodiesterase family protein n=1 Tax=Microtetraspora malaysiensis TaxID=161358 RepID=UPI0008370C52|nr:glycerophosphodiester phosphodiesterase family protein [Microtetraspora malaysiensis]
MHGHVEIHGHRGARGLRPENTLPGLAFALELGVDALEFDVALSSDGQIVLTHDLIVSPVTSADTGMATPGDEMFPYVGKPIASLSLAQLRTLDVGIRLPKHPDDPFALTQVPLPDTHMPTLGSVLGLVDAYGADGVRLHVELKSDPERPELTADPREFTELVVEELDRHGRLGNAALLSFDWRILEAARPLVDRRFALVEEVTKAPAWMNGLDLADFDGDLAAAAEAVGATTLSPDRVLVDDALMAAASDRGLPVVVWTVNDPDEAARLLDLGVAGLVTDYPDRMRRLWAARGLPLPAPIPPLRTAVA